jgi:nucleotidyltransferase/DNA polymerase involved in DNA repair
MIACVHFPWFGAAVARAGLPDTGDAPLIAADYRHGRGRVAVCDAAAAALGAAPGMPLPRARALVPEAQVVLWSPGAARRAGEALLGRLSTFSQYVEWTAGDAQHGTALLDLGRLLPDAGWRIAAQLLEVGAAAGLNAQVGLAAAPFPALAAAISAPPGGVTLIHAARTAAFLAEQPAALLPASAEVARRLALFGLVRLGQIAALPRAALLEQFGREGVRLHRLACGDDGRRLCCWQPPQIVRAGRAFEPPLEDRLIAAQVLAGLAAELMGPLQAAGQTVGEIRLCALQDGAGEREAARRPRLPLENTAGLARALDGLLDRLALSRPVTALTVEIGRFAALMPRQLTLFGDDALRPSPQQVIAAGGRWDDLPFYTVAIGQPSAPIPEMRYRLDVVEAA